MKTSVHLSLPLLAVVSTVALVACGGGGGNPVVAPAPEPLTVAKASCATGNRPETGLQGQVDASLRANGFNGFNCNLDLVGSYKGDGAGVSFASFKDHAGRTCTYHSTSSPALVGGQPVGLQNPGVTVLDITDPATPIRTASLTSIAMIDPLESMRLNGQRQILVASNGYQGVGGSEVDVYDLSSDCRTPQLLASAPVGTGADGGVYTPNSPLSKGHEGAISPDGLTYYMGDFTNNVYRAIDITDPAKPKQIAVFDMKGLPGKAHGLSVSADGNRVYAAAFGLPTLAQVADPAAYPINGFVVLDTSEVQARKPNAAITLISTAFHKDGSAAQHTLPMKVAGKSYLVQVDEGGSAGVLTDAGFKAACAAKLPPFPMARIYDIQDDSDPKLVSKLMLETHDPANCAKVAPDVVGLGLYAYGSHFCSVDNRENATALACAYFNSGIRVFDIRDPAKPKELAYFNPASGPLLPGSAHAKLQQWREKGPDWCGAQLHFDFDRKQLVSACMDNGVQVLQFAPNTWPFAQSVASALQQ
uniref:FedA n=1 Tax=Burkholderia sp. NF100 TaxID=91917 RepID=Q25C66_9BURK|nr:FedA [Burkholderia sp. NF100]